MLREIWRIFTLASSMLPGSDQLLLQFNGQILQPGKESAMHRLKRRAFAVNPDIQCGNRSAI